MGGASNSAAGAAAQGWGCLRQAGPAAAAARTTITMQPREDASTTTRFMHDSQARIEDGDTVGKAENAVRNVSTTVQPFAGALISVLMIAKLIEEIMFIRKLRRSSAPSGSVRRRRRGRHGAGDQQ